VIVLFFAASFLVADAFTAAHALTATRALEVVQLSLNAIHGRVFFSQFTLDTPDSWLATIESIVGIVIDGIFVAMLIQRFFDR